MIKLFKKLATQKDKQLHFLGSVMLSIGFSILLVMITSYLTAVLGAFFLTTIIGIGKEVYDSLGHGTPDIEDVYADVLGTLFGILIFSIFYGLWSIL